MIQHYANDTRAHAYHAFTNEAERDAFVRADRIARSVASDNYALGSLAEGWDLILHGEAHVPDYWRHYVAWDVEPTGDPDVRRAFADVAHVLA